jgi:ATP-dependent helicase IRC3
MAMYVPRYLNEGQRRRFQQSCIDILGASPPGQDSPANDHPKWHSPIALRPYQVETLEAIAAAEARGIRRQVIHLPTGAGKTVIFSHLALGRPGRTLILVHRDELVVQTIDKLRMVAGDAQIDVGIVKAARDEHDAGIVVATVQTLQRETRLQRLAKDFELIVIDECHHATPKSGYDTVLQALGAYAANSPLVVGCTATPFHPNGDPLIDPKKPGCFEAIVHAVPTAWMMHHGYLTPVVGKRIDISDFDLGRVRVSRGDYDEHDLSDAMLAANAPTQIAAGFVKLALGRRALFFCPTVGMVNAMALHLRQLGLTTACVTRATKPEERQVIYAKLRQGQLDALVSCMVLTEGFDESSVDCVVLARPTRSKVLFAQAVGRGLRPSPDTHKRDCLLIDATGATERHGLFSMAAELGLMKGEEPGEQQERDAAASKPREEVEGSCTLRDVDVIQNLLHWVVTAKGYYVVQFPDERLKTNRILRIRPDEAGTYALETRRQDEKRYATMVRQLTLDYCFGVATDTVRDAKILGMVKRDAQWRHKARSPKQEKYARSLGIAIDPGWRMGDVSDAINRVIGDKYDYPIDAQRKVA